MSKLGDILHWRRWGRFTLATLLTGDRWGAGWLVALLLHSVQHLAYGYSLDAVISSESFLQGSAMRRRGAVLRR
ncbi:hypothetical protein O0544_13110 [Edwardsiella anguillarum]|nr:hypothetical protein [Edwardsiella anguillarum]